MRTLILEDEAAAADNLKFLLAREAPDFQILAVLEMVSQGKAWLTENEKPDVIFSDIELADGDAFAIFTAVPPPCPVVFTTAYDAHALRAFQHNGIDYLLKPIKLEELRRAITRLRERRPSEPDAAKLRKLLTELQLPTYRQSFLLPFRKQLIPVRTEELAYFYSERNVTFARPQEGNRRYVVEETLEQLETQLDPERFFRVNRQTIINRTAIRGLKSHINGRFLLLLEPPPDWQVVVSKAKAPRLRSWLGA